VLGDATLVQLAARLPADRAALASVSGCTPRVVERWGDSVLETIAPRSRYAAATDPAHGAAAARTPQRGAAARRGAAGWRTEASQRVGLEPGLVLPNRLITLVAEAAPRDVESLARIDGVRRWRAEAFGVSSLPLSLQWTDEELADQPRP
jgi:ribonuclease D